MSAYDWIEMNVPVPMVLYIKGEESWEPVQMNDACKKFFHLDNQPLDIDQKDFDFLHNACLLAVSTGHQLQKFSVKGIDQEYHNVLATFDYLEDEEILVVSFADIDGEMSE